MTPVPNNQQATGSIWNQNNWHWESKNYTKPFSDLLTKKVTGHTFNRDEFKFTFTKLDKLTGEATISVRKGKQILCYQFECDIEWRVESKTQEDKGSFHVTDINEAELDFEINALTCANDTAIGPKARGIMKKCAKDEMLLLL